MNDLQRMRNRQSTLLNWASFNNVSEMHLLRGQADSVHPEADAHRQGGQGQSVSGGASRGDQLGPCRSANSDIGEICGLGCGACKEREVR